MLRTLTLAALAAAASARIHSLTISDDPRFAFSIESFGFLDGGKVDLDIHDVRVKPADQEHIMGFVVYPAATEASVSEHIDALIANRICALDVPPPGALVINISDPSTWKDYQESAEVTGPGMFNLLFTHCSPVGSDVSVSFQLEADFVNPGPNYLSAGDMPLPTVFGVMTAMFGIALGVWIWYTRRHKIETKRIHRLMTMLLATKVFCLLFEAVMYAYIASTGHNTAWNGMFYLFSFLKGGLMAVVTLLAASGYSIMKPFLHEREKNILVVAVFLQMLTSTAIVMTDELAPGSISFLAWTNILHIADFLAAGFVVVPLAWSMRYLQQAQAASGGDADAKAGETLSRLAIFRNFYLATITYVYVTRFLLYLLGTTLPYNGSWFVAFADELATLLYYVTVGYKFRPHTENAYLKVEGEDDDDVATIGSATGAAAGAVEGAAPAVQTVAATRRGPVQTISAAAAAAEDGAAEEGATAPKVESAGAASAAAGGGGKKKAHAIDSDDDDDEFGLDEDDAAELGKAGTGANGASAGAAAAADEEDDDDLDEGLETQPLAPAGAGLKQVNKLRDGR